MANSRITLTFNNSLELGNNIEIQDSNISGFNIVLNWNVIPVTGDVDLDIQNALNYLELNYNVVNRYDISADFFAKTIGIEDNLESGVQFSEVANDTGGRITSYIENVPAPPINIQVLSYQPLVNVSNSCSLFDLSVTTNTQAEKYIVKNGATEDVAVNPFIVSEIDRDSLNLKEVTVKGVNSETVIKFYLPFLETAMFKLDVVQNPSSSSLNIEWIGAYEPSFNLTYSLDNVTFYSSTSFSGLAEGNYTLYIKDNIGCEIQIPFVIDEFTPNVFKRKPIFNISEHNSLIYVKREVIDGCNTFRNAYNTMSYEEDTQINQRDFKQPFQTCDGVVTQQIKTIYDNVNIDLIDCQGNKTNLPLTLKSNNIGRTDIRDVKIRALSYLGSEFVGVSYVSGKTYDTVTLDENGSYYLGASVPEFMNIDDLINIEGAGWYKVKDVKFAVDNIQYLILDVLVSNFPISVIQQTLKGTSVYNALPYEVYEFEFNLGALNGDYYLNVKATDSEFDSIEYSTEWFNVAEEQPSTYVLQYYNSINNATNYSTGIRYKIRIPYSTRLTEIANDTQDVVVTDTNAFTVESEFRKFSELKTRNIPACFKNKITTALLNDRLFLNGVSKLKNKEIEQERIGLTNTYTMVINFIETDYVYSNIATDGTVTDEGQVLGVDDNIIQALGVKQI